ncbi:Hsp20/alpha crystallin family protein [Geodermatophilus sp. SYSU D01186]
MTSNLQRRDKGTQTSPFARLDRMFEEWLRSGPIRRSFPSVWEGLGEDVISVDEYRDGDTQVIRAELAGIDPDRDVELTVLDGTLRIDAERRVEQDTEDRGYTRHELRYGRFTRTLPLPPGATESDIAASYRDGILEIRVPIAEPPAEPTPTRIPIAKG